MPTIILEKIKQTTGKNYALVDAEDVEMPDGSRLPAAIPTLVPITQDEYNALEAEGEIDPTAYYMIARAGT